MLGLSNLYIFASKQCYFYKSKSLIHFTLGGFISVYSEAKIVAVAKLIVYVKLNVFIFSFVKSRVRSYFLEISRTPSP